MVKVIIYPFNVVIRTNKPVTKSFLNEYFKGGDFIFRYKIGSSLFETCWVDLQDEMVVPLQDTDGNNNTIEIKVSKINNPFSNAFYIHEASEFDSMEEMTQNLCTSFDGMAREEMNKTRSATASPQRPPSSGLSTKESSTSISSFGISFANAQKAILEKLEF